MSLKTWKDEFYPEEAQDAAERGAVAAIEHSLRKWRGLTPKNLKKHEVELCDFWFGMYVNDHEDQTLPLNGTTCALCKAVDDCSDCPVVTTGHTGCDEPGSAYHAFRTRGNPSQMIRVLEAVLAAEKEKQ